MASSLKLYTTGNMGKAVIDSATSEATGYPKENMVDGNLDTYWKATSKSTQWIIFDLQEAKTVGVLLLFIKNYKEISAGSVDRYWSDNGSDWTFVSGGPSLVDASTPIRISTTGLGLTHRYWRLRVADTVSHIVRLAGLWWGSYYNIAHGNVLPQDDEDQFFNRVSRLPGGRLAVAGINRNYVENPSRRYLVEAGTPYSNLLSAFQDSRGILHPLIMNEGAAQSDARVVRFADDRLPHPMVLRDGLREIEVRLRGVPYIDDGDLY